MNEWRPIESAPRDGRQLILWRIRGSSYDVDPGSHAVIGNWVKPDSRDSGCWNIPFEDLWTVDEDLTHWMPIPDPPQ